MRNRILVATTALFIVGYGIKQTQKPKQKTIDTPAASIARGSMIYQKECLSCHQADGGGVPHINPPLAGNSVLLKDKLKAVSVVLRGMTDRIPIDDEYYSNNMASHAYLTNQQIADVLTYARNSFGNNAGAITVEVVKLARIGKKK